MKTLLVVITTLAVILALARCCFAAGGDHATAEIPTAHLTILITNKLLYDITSSYGTSATIVQAWIRRLNEKIRGTIRYTERLRSVLVNRVAHLRHKLRGLKGGRARECFFGQTWNLQLQPDETDASNAEIETLQAKLDSSEKEKSKLQETVKLLQSTPTQKRHKPYEQLSERQKRRMKRRRESTCEASLSWLDQDGYEPLSVEVRNRETGNIEKISLKRHDMEELFGSESSITESEMDELNMMLYVKDRYNVSDGAYHEMAKVCKEMPRQYKLKERIRKLNQEWNIWPTPNGTVGVQQSLEQRLRIRIEQLLKVSSPNSTFCQSRKVRIKLSGDGTKIGKRLHVVSFTFTILEQGERPGSYEGNHILAVFKEPEDYDSVKNALADIIKEVEQLQKIEVDGITYELEYYMGGDWKFLAMITGIDSASCAYACIWCKCKADERYDADREWSISDPSKGARSTDENIKMSRQPRTRKQYNVSRLPLFPTIPLDHVVIDNLHLFLRVADVLINLLIIELRRQDAIQKQLKFTRFDPLKYRHCDAFQQFVSSLGIPGFHFYIGESSKQLKVRSLTGPEKLKVFEHIEIHTLLPSVLPSECDVDKIQHLWTELWLLNMEICKPASELTTEVIERYERRARQWGKDFIDVYHTDRVTPYIHAMMNHVSQFMKIHGSIVPFTQQGLEKLNDTITKNFFRSTSHRGEDALRQLIEKQNRLEYLSDSGAKKPKLFEITCSNCNTTGHNRLSCRKPCKHCSAPYAQHLTTVDSKKIPACQKEN